MTPGAEVTQLCPQCPIFTSLYGCWAGIFKRSFYKSIILMNQIWRYWDATFQYNSFFFPSFFNYIRKEFSFLSSQKLLQLFLWKNLSMQMLWSRGVKYRNGAVLLSKCLLLSLYKCSQIYSLQISGKKKKCNHSSLTQDLLEFSTVGKTLNKYWKLDIRFLKLDTWKRGIPKLGLNLH